MSLTWKIVISFITLSILTVVICAYIFIMQMITMLNNFVDSMGTFFEALYTLTHPVG